MAKFFYIFFPYSGNFGIKVREGFKKKVIIITFGGEGGQRGSFITFFWYKNDTATFTAFTSFLAIFEIFFKCFQLF